jgi:DNA polymerase-3 subunit epsilon
MIKKIFYDVETTGLDSVSNGIHQLSGCIEIDGVVVEWFNFNVRPFPTDIIDSEAIKISNVSIEKIMGYEKPEIVHKKFIDLLGKHVGKYNKQDKLFLIGYNNSRFDDQFLRSWFGKNNDKYYGSWFWPNTIDVMSLASNFLVNNRVNMVNFKLKTVAKEFGLNVDESKLHDALYDIELTRGIYNIVNEPILKIKMKSRNIMDDILTKNQKNHNLTNEQVMSVVDYLCGSGDISNLYNYYGHEIMS